MKILWTKGGILRNAHHREKETGHHPAPVRNFLLTKEMRATGKISFGGRYGCPGFYRVFVSTTGL